VLRAQGENSKHLSFKIPYDSKYFELIFASHLLGKLVTIFSFVKPYPFQVGGWISAVWMESFGPFFLLET
jgi:hypothetical protein